MKRQLQKKLASQQPSVPALSELLNQVIQVRKTLQKKDELINELRLVNNDLSYEIELLGSCELISTDYQKLNITSWESKDCTSDYAFHENFRIFQMFQILKSLRNYVSSL